MKNYICINGKKAELTEEQLKALGIKLPTQFDRVNENQNFYYIGCDGEVGVTRECLNGFDTKCFNAANYCTDKSIMEQRALHETLNRLLWRYSMEHDGDKIEWNDQSKPKYHICYNSSNKTLSIFEGWMQNHAGAPNFYTKEIAKNAIKEVIEPFIEAHPDFKW